MPTFTEHAGIDRNRRVNAFFAPPLPNPSPKTNPKDNYDVIIVGAGPAGLFLKLLLSRFGLSDAEVLCVDRKPGTLQTGQADGLQPRTLEVLATLGLAEEVLTEGCHMWEVGFWNAGDTDSCAVKRTEGAPEGATEGGPPAAGSAIATDGTPTPAGKPNARIERTSYAPDVVARARFPHEVTIHQGRIERILSEDLARYSPAGVQQCTRFAGLSPSSDQDFPLAVELEIKDDSESAGNNPAITKRSVRAKHIVAADGAHSAVREAAGLKLVGESRDYIWGVVDFVADTDFPDVRRRCAIHSEAGSAMVIPRERISSGEYLTRLYIQMDDVETEDGGGGGKDDGAVGGGTPSKEERDEMVAARLKARTKRGRVTLDTLLRQAAQVFRPYYLRMKPGSEPDWWAAYQIGQRMADAFTRDDEDGIPRVFVAGDAAHTHSPKAGQGMNVSLMDSYNLAWKLAYYLRGLGPAPSTSSDSGALRLLHTYSSERESNARNLIDFDTRFSSMFSGKVGSTEHDASGEPLTHEKFLEVFSAGSGFSSGCGIEYEGSVAVVADGMIDAAAPADGGVATDTLPWIRTNWPAEKQNALLAGALWPGRRLVSVRVIRHADGIPMQLHECLASTGRFRVLLLLSDIVDAHVFAKSASWHAVERIGRLLDQGVVGKLVEMLVLHPTPGIRGTSWNAFPPALKTHAEMRFFCAAPGEAPEGKRDGKMGLMGVSAEDAYAVLGVRKEKGAWAAVRPDGVVGAMGGLSEIGLLETYLAMSIDLGSQRL